MQDPTRRFSDRVENYIKYRPTYPQAVIETLVAECHLTAASIIADIQKQPVRDEFRQALLKISGNPQVALQNADFAISNLVKKTNSEKVITHFVNYSKTAENVGVKLDLSGVVRKVDPKSIRLLSPDDVSKELKDVVVNGTTVNFTIPKLEVYDVVSIN